MAKRSSSRPSKKKNAGGKTVKKQAATEMAAKKRAAKKNVKRKAATGAEPGVAPDHGRQQDAKAAAKKSRIKRSGLESRVLGHVSSRGKRAQARRDSKN